MNVNLNASASVNLCDSGIVGSSSSVLCFVLGFTLDIHCTVFVVDVFLCPMALIFLLDIIALYYCVSWFDDDSCHYLCLHNNVTHLFQVLIDVAAHCVHNCMFIKHRSTQLLLLLLASFTLRRVGFSSLYLIGFDNDDHTANIH